MIASYLHKFIFIKTMKTAGTSIEFALSPHCGPQDILAPIGAAQDIDRHKLLGVLPRNFAKDPEIEQLYQQRTRDGRRKMLRAQLKQARQHKASSGTMLIVHPHARAQKIRRWVTKELWENSLRFTTERHPYEKAVSFAYHRLRPGGDFAQILDESIRMKRGYPGWRFYTIDGKVVAHRFIRHESLKDDLAAICRDLNLPELELPARRSESRKEKKPAAEVLSDEQKRIVYEACAPEFEYFGWTR